MNSLTRFISNYTNSYYKKSYGKGPEKVTVKVMDNILLIHIKGFMTSIEKDLLKNDNGQKLVIEIRQNLFDQNENKFLNFFDTILRNEPIEIFSDWNPINNSLCTTVVFKEKIDTDREYGYDEKMLNIIFS